jgi:class 3 adenylate cyclase
MKRKIAAIMAADVAGYSKLIADDEEETLCRLASYRAVFDDFIARASGRVFNTAGDAIFAEFPSAVDAVRCAIDVQESLRTRNLAFPSSRHMHFRIGMTIGDVVERNGDLLGDGVNIAARLQTLATPGGLCVSSTVYEQVANKLSVKFSDIGEQQVKNIPSPIHAYTLAVSSSEATSGMPRGELSARAIGRRRIALFAAYFSGLLTYAVAGQVAGFAPPAEWKSWSWPEQSKLEALVPERVPSEPTGISQKKNLAPRGKSPGGITRVPTSRGHIMVSILVIGKTSMSIVVFAGNSRPTVQVAGTGGKARFVPLRVSRASDLAPVHLADAPRLHRGARLISRGTPIGLRGSGVVANRFPSTEPAFGIRWLPRKPDVKVPQSQWPSTQIESRQPSDKSLGCARYIPGAGLTVRVPCEE